MVEKNIFIASPRGFCAGVVRAISILEEVVKNSNGRIVYVFHEIIHNKCVLNSFINQGVRFIESLDEVKENRDKCIIVLSAHGVPQAVHDIAKNISQYVVDATCPLVKKVHNEAKSIIKSGSELLIIGDKNHPEVIGINGMVNNKGHVVKSMEDVIALEMKLNDRQIKRIDYVIQTTLNVDDVEIIVKAIQDKYSDRYDITLLSSKKNVCYATKNRQDAIKYIIKDKNIDYSIIVGSKNSSNANSMVNLIRGYGIDSVLVDEYDALDLGIIYNARNILISSAASTPEFLVKDLVDNLCWTINGFDIIVNDISFKEEDTEFKYKVIL